MSIATEYNSATLNKVLTSNIFNGAGLTLIHKYDDEYSILIGKSNSNKPYKHNVWVFGGGKKEDGENAIQTAYREFMEEIFNIHIDIKLVDDIIKKISENTENTEMYDITTNLSNNHDIPSYTFLQTSNALTIMVNVLVENNINSDVFPFGYDGLYNKKKQINIYNFCSQRRYIMEKAMPEKNEIVFIVMAPIDNLIRTINICKSKNVYYYHGENLKIHVPSVMRQIKTYLESKDDLDKISSLVCEIKI
jgi:hypothetical protein